MRISRYFFAYFLHRLFFFCLTPTHFAYCVCTLSGLIVNKLGPKSTWDASGCCLVCRWWAATPSFGVTPLNSPQPTCYPLWVFNVSWFQTLHFFSVAHLAFFEAYFNTHTQTIKHKHTHRHTRTHTYTHIERRKHFSFNFNIFVLIVIWKGDELSRTRAERTSSEPFVSYPLSHLLPRRFTCFMCVDVYV